MTTIFIKNQGIAKSFFNSIPFGLRPLNYGRDVYILKGKIPR